VDDNTSTNDTQRVEPEGSGINRRTFNQGAVGVAAVAGAAAAGLFGWAVTRTDQEHDAFGVSRSIPVSRVGAIPVDPADPAWDGQAQLTVPLSPQHVTAPRLSRDDGVIPAAALRAIHDGSDIAFQVQWEDEDAHDIEAIARFTDSLALQFPVDPSVPTSAMMGQPGRPVHILQWRASWQREIDEGPREVRDAFPHVANDLRPEEVFDESTATVYYPARHVGNIAATLHRTSSVEEIVGEGFGTITTHEEQRAQGHAAFRDGRWTVVVSTPMNGGENRARFQPGGAQLVSVAIWDGGKGDRGGRKQWAGWIRLELES
jgi:hypothetical protein